VDVAHALHRSSKRSQAAFVPIDCAAVPAEALEAELFGHEKGAFVGALTSNAGRFELAASGTLFLDSVAVLPLSLQTKVLRAMTKGRIERVGGTTPIHASPRIVAAGGADLDDAVERGAFREDLYRLLASAVIEVPPLRQRQEDLPALISHVAARVEAKHNLTLRFTPAALAALAAYDWPRNVRELEHQIERLALVHGQELIDVANLPSKVHTSQECARESVAPSRDVAAPAPGLLDPEHLPLLPVNGIDLRDYLTRLERSLIQQALNDTHHVVARAADRLHIRRTTLVEKMRKYGLSRLDHDQAAPEPFAGDASV
jgi:sigma-54 specific flagellar transcriptional regulator A